MLATSLVWACVVLLLLVFIWGYQDKQAQWELVERLSTQEALAARPALVSPPAARPWQPTPTSSQTLIQSPSATPAEVARPLATPMAEILPETQLLDQPSPTPLRAGRLAASPTPARLKATPSRPVEPSPTAPFFPTFTPTRQPTPASPAADTPTATPAVDSTALSSRTLADDITIVQPAVRTRHGQPTRLVIRSVGIDAPVVAVVPVTVTQNGQQYSTWPVADFAAGWHATSALPGQPGNIVLAGHHNIKGEVFRYLVDVQEGDEIDLYIGDAVYRYYVEQKMILKEKGEPLAVRQQNAMWIAPTPDERVTLVTCWPYTNNTHRVVVVAKPRSEARRSGG